MTQVIDLGGGVFERRFVPSRLKELPFYDWMNPQSAFVVPGYQQSNNSFGFDVALSSDGSTMIVGAPGNNTNGNYAGEAYIYTRSGNTWILEENLVPQVRDANDHFGESVAISADGNIALVGAPNAGPSNNGHGNVFLRTNGVWAWKVLTSGGAGFQLGSGCAISNDGVKVVFGGVGTGFYSFNYNLDAYLQGTGLKTHSGGAVFGSILAMSGDGTVVVAGMPNVDTGGGGSSHQGQIVICGGSNFNTMTIGRPPNQNHQDFFGWSVDINYDATRIVAGAWKGHEGASGDSGAVSIFDKNGPTINDWDFTLFLETVVHGEPNSNARYGSGVSISDDGTVVGIGAPAGNQLIAYGGTGFIFKLDGTWELQGRVFSLDALNGNTNSLMGECAAISGDGKVLALGAPNDRHSGTTIDTGSVSTFNTT